MKKKIIIILSVLIITLTIVKLYQTFATNSLVTVSDNVYNITLTDNSSITVPAKSSKTIIYQICNTNKGVVQYEVGYTSTGSNIEVKEWWDTADSTSGTIDYGENKFVKLKLSNNDTEDTVFTLSTILGYEHGGDLIVPTTTSAVTKKVNEKNYLKSITSSLDKTEISSITFVNNNIAPAGVKEYVDVSQNGDGSVMLWYGEANDSGLYDVYIGSDNGITSLSTGAYLFSGYSSLISIDLENVDTSDVTDMNSMFMGCSSLTTLNLSSFDTSKVTIMGGPVEHYQGMFQNCTSLKSLDLSSFDTSKVTIMGSMFKNCKKLVSLNLNGWNTSNVTNMAGLFKGCAKLTNLNLNSFDTSNVTNMGEMFYNCASLTYLDVSKFDTNNVTSMTNMFWGCEKLVFLNLSNFDTSNVTSMNSMFRNCKSLKTLDLSSFDTSNVTTMGSSTEEHYDGMFQNCSSLTTLDLSNFDTSNLVSMGTMFTGCTKLKSINLSSFNTSKVTSVWKLFSGCSALTSIELSNADFASVKIYTKMLEGVDKTNLVINGNAGLKDWFTTNYSDYANNVVVPTA